MKKRILDSQISIGCSSCHIRVLNPEPERIVRYDRNSLYKLDEWMILTTPTPDTNQIEEIFSKRLSIATRTLYRSLPEVQHPIKLQTPL
jgi:hypothetical protein